MQEQEDHRPDVKMESKMKTEYDKYIYQLEEWNSEKKLKIKIPTFEEFKRLVHDYVN